MTLVRKNIISNNSWHIYYALSLAFPYLLNLNKIFDKNNSQFSISLLYVVLRLGFNIDKYLNMVLLTTIYNYYIR